MKRKPTIGETLYSLNVENAARNTPQVLTPLKVTKVGRKYFTLGEGWQEAQFHLSSWKENSDYTPSHRIYETEQSYKDEKEEGEISNRIYKAFEYGRNTQEIPLSKLREIDQMLTVAPSSLGD